MAPPITDETLTSPTISSEVLRASTIEEIPAISQTYAQMIIADGPEVYYRMGDASGATVVDASGHGRDGTIELGVAAPIFGVAGAIAGDADTAIHFNGDGTGAHGSSLKTPAALDTIGSAAFTIETWAKLTTPIEAMIAGRGDFAADANMQWWFWWRGNNFEFAVWQTGAIKVICGGGLQSIPSGASYRQLVGVYDGAAISLYTNGALVAGPTSVAGALQVPATKTLRVSPGAVAMPTFPFGGPLDEVAFYSRALSAVEVSRHYILGTTGVTPPPYTRNFGIPTITDEYLIVKGAP